MVDLVDELREKAAQLPADGAPVVQRARGRAEEAVEILTAALDVDPTLVEPDRCLRDVDLVRELLRQLQPLARQAEVELERRRLAADPATAHQTGRLGRTNPHALEELEALSRRCVEIAERIAGAALPDWNTPQRIRERSERLLPSAAELEEIADRLRHAVRASLDLPYPAPEAERLAALADQITIATQGRRRRCAGPGCSHVLEPASTGRPRRYCGPTCRQRAHRLVQPASGRAGDGDSRGLA
ncbi:hypothetical protein GCM10023191_102080 [Actinoallomurus oryzae]|uniref:Zinc finger CGNR domain-containing protein n=1 Tax=Actinoallomurus oryzae TaxID=502180 RepID=A0ABP8R9H4_9ACTN